MQTCCVWVSIRLRNIIKNFQFTKTPLLSPYCLEWCSRFSIARLIFTIYCFWFLSLTHFRSFHSAVVSEIMLPNCVILYSTLVQLSPFLQSMYQVRGGLNFPGSFLQLLVVVVAQLSFISAVSLFHCVNPRVSITSPMVPYITHF